MFSSNKVWGVLEEISIDYKPPSMSDRSSSWHSYATGEHDAKHRLETRFDQRGIKGLVGGIGPMRRWPAITSCPYFDCQIFVSADPSHASYERKTNYFRGID